jgi:hypothetical protein
MASQMLDKWRTVTTKSLLSYLLDLIYSPSGGGVAQRATDVVFLGPEPRAVT